MWYCLTQLLTGNIRLLEGLYWTDCRVARISLTEVTHIDQLVHMDHLQLPPHSLPLLHKESFFLLLPLLPARLSLRTSGEHPRRQPEGSQADTAALGKDVPLWFLLRFSFRLRIGLGWQGGDERLIVHQTVGEGWGPGDRVLQVLAGRCYQIL